MNARRASRSRALARRVSTAAGARRLAARCAGRGRRGADGPETRTSATARSPRATPVYVEIYEPTIPIPADPAGRARVRLHQGRRRQQQLARSGLVPVARRRGRRGCQDHRREPRPAAGDLRPDRRAGLPGPGQLRLPVGPGGGGQRADPRHGDAHRRDREGDVRPDRLLDHLRHLRRRGRAAEVAAVAASRACPGSRACPPCRSRGSSTARWAPSTTLGDRPATTSRSARCAPRRERADCQIPAQLSALASFGGFAGLQLHRAHRRPRSSAPPGPPSATSACCGGVVTLSGVTAKVTSSSDGTTPKGKGKASLRHHDHRRPELRRSVRTASRAAGRPRPDPGPARRARRPRWRAARHHAHRARARPSSGDGKEVKSVVEGLIVEIDTKTLSRRACARCRSRTSSTSCPPRTQGPQEGARRGRQPVAALVLHLGRATSKVETVGPDRHPRRGPGQRPRAATATTGGAGGRRRRATGGARRHAHASGRHPGGSGRRRAGRRPRPRRVLARPACPPLFSIPGLLLVGGIGGAVRRGQLCPPARCGWRSAGAAPAPTASTPACPTCER